MIESVDAPGEDRTRIDPGRCSVALRVARSTRSRPASAGGAQCDQRLSGQVCAVGDNRPYNVALIVLDAEYLPSWAKKQGIDASGVSELAENEQVLAAVQEAVDAANAKMSRVEQIKKFKLLGDEWQPGGDELTPTMKLKRKPIAEKYEAEIEALYAK